MMEHNVQPDDDLTVDDERPNSAAVEQNVPTMKETWRAIRGDLEDLQASLQILAHLYEAPGD